MGFPANMNVAAALALAGIGPERTTVEIWADPGVSRNCHTVDVDADSANFTMAIQNIPSENAKTGRITALSDLPSKRIISGYIKEGMKLNDAGVKSPTRSKPKTPKEVIVPDDLTMALQKNKKALATFATLPPSHKREYIEWITEAKTETTRTRRLETAVEWMAEGKSRNWKYMNC